jgi:cytochrome oxidase assembly protein ShyY1
LSFLLRPRWILSHLFVLAVIVAFVNLGFWQLRRLDERRDRNAVIEANLHRDPVPIDELGDIGDDDRFRAVTVSGRHVGVETRVANRSYEGAPGEWQIALVDTGSGAVVPVNRGFLSEGTEAPAASGEVEIEGYVVPRDRLDRTARIDLDAFLAAHEAVPALVQVTRSVPPDALALTAVPPPALGDGPHLSYAVQWFIFATIAAIGYPLALRRIVQRREVTE